MDALELLLNRRSASRLTEPAPSGEVLDKIIYAGMRVPDHGTLQPWRFFVIRGEGRQRLSDLLSQSAIGIGLNEEEINKAKRAPFRAPLIIAVVAHCDIQSNISPWEQVVSACCTVYAMQLAALAQGFNGIWRTGVWATQENIRTAFGCREQDKIVGFLYLGTPLLKGSTITTVRIPDTRMFVHYF